MQRIIRKIEYPKNVKFDTYRDWQSAYLNAETGELIPDTEIWIGGEKVMKVNSLGCKGDDIDRSMPTVAFFGDSATFGVSFSTDSWPAHVRIKGVQVLNCAVEGYDMARCVKRYEQIIRQIDPVAVVVYAGWHNIIYNFNTEDYWKVMLDRFSGRSVRAFCSIATCLTDECREKGIDSLLCSDVPRADYANYFEYNAVSLKKHYFNYWCNLEPAKDHIGFFLDNIARYNGFLKEYCARTGSIYIDLENFLKPKSYRDIPKDFFDVCHLRPNAYKKTGAYAAKALAAPVREALVSRGGNSGRLDVVVGERHPVSDGEDLRKNIYPLW
jgi:hypothetical protein